MPSALLGGSAPSAPSGSATGSSAARTGSDSDGNRRDFDALLKPDSGSARTGTGRKATDKADSAAPGQADATTAPAPGEDGKDAAASTETTAKPATEDKTAAAEPAEDSETAPWPPLGLAGLALAGIAVPTPTAVTPALQATETALTSALPGSAPAPALAATTLPGVPATAAAGTPTDTAGAALALPAALAGAAPGAEDAPLLKAFTDTLNSAVGDAADAPATPLLHALQQLADTRPATAAAFTGSPTATPNLGAEDFDDAIGARVGWLADQKIGHAHIKISPNDLGPIDVRLQLDGDKVHASFTSAHAEVRHALESTLPRLREMLNEQGFQLGQADVGQQQTAREGHAGDGGSGRGGSDGKPALADTTVSPAQLMRQRGLLDAYA